MTILGGITTTIEAPAVTDEEPAGLQIRIESGDGYVAAYDAATGIFGAGDDFAAAFGDLAAALVEHRDVLERQERLSPELARQLAYLRRHLPR